MNLSRSSDGHVESPGVPTCFAGRGASFKRTTVYNTSNSAFAGMCEAATHTMIPPLVSDSKLVAACLSGDARSWDTLIARYQGLIYALALRMGLPAADADDVFQNVCLRMFQHLNELRDTERLSGWLVAMTRQEVWRLRRRREMPLMTELPDVAREAETVRKIGGHTDPTPEEAVLMLEEQHLVRQCLNHLPEECRKLLTLLYGEESPGYAAVAAHLSMPVGSIGPKRARCLQRLKKLLDEIGF